MTNHMPITLIEKKGGGGGEGGAFCIFFLVNGKYYKTKQLRATKLRTKPERIQALAISLKGILNVHRRTGV